MVTDLYLPSLVRSGQDNDAVDQQASLPAARVGRHALGQARRFLLADGRRLELDFGEARAAINGESVTTLVVFGEDDAPALLGAYTLEGLALAVDPVNQRLVPTDLIMYQ